MTPVQTKDQMVIDGQRCIDPTSPQIIADLRELITALDRRAPRLERSRERDIARSAAALRDEAMQRIAEFERSCS